MIIKMVSYPPVKNKKIEDLVKHISGSSSPRQLKRLTERARTIAIDHRFTRVPHTDDVKEIYEGLVEKYSVCARDDLAEALSARIQVAFQMKPNFYSDQTKVSALALILKFSCSSALEKTIPNEIISSSLFSSSDSRSHALAWQDILQEDPLEGQHWMIPSEEDDASDYESYEEDNDLNNIEPDPLKSNTTNNVDDDDSDYESIDFRTK
ncbi:hypothetical protein V1511DRAFT_496294 [Dipodascopsis uninucleata]